MNIESSPFYSELNRHRVLKLVGRLPNEIERVSESEHEKVLIARGGSERSGDRRSAEWRRVGGSTNRPCACGHPQLRREGKTGTHLWRSGRAGGLKGRRQETYDVIEICLIIDAGEPGFVGGARMRERHRGDDQKR
jgi:hypothetical protein